MSETQPIVTQPLQPRKRAMIIGASSGFGAALAKELASHGYDLGLISRRLDLLQELCGQIEAGAQVRAFAYAHDVTDVQAVPALLQRAVRDLGGLDLFIYSAGIMYPHDPEAYEPEQDLETLRVNLLGAVAWLNPVAQRFVQAGQGHIVGVGSIAGDRGRRAIPAYAASKAGLHAYLESLRNRVSRFGVRVTTLKPGQMETGMLKGAEKIRRPVRPERAAELAWRAISSGKQQAYIPARWALVALAVRNIPSFVFRRLDL